MAIMIRNTLLFSAVFLTGALAFAQPAPSRQARFGNRILDDVVQMTRAGLSDDTIVAYIRARRSRLASDLRAEDLIQLRKAGVSENVVRYIAGATGLHVDEGAISTSVQAEGDGEDVPYSDEAVYDGYAPWGYPYPYWYAYSPYFFGGVIIRGGGFHRGFGHRSFGHGHFGGGGHSGGGGHHGGGGHGHR